MNPLEYIKLEATTLVIGETTRNIECPFCPKGNKEKHSLAVTREAQGLIFKCHRASCNETGFIHTMGASIKVKDKKKKFEPQYFRRPLVTLPDPVKNWLKEKYYLTDKQIRYNHLKYDAERNMLYNTIFDINGYEVGDNTKALPEKFAKFNTSYIKSKAHWHNDVVKLYFPKYTGERDISEIYIVEDALSAIRLSKFVFCCALLGSSITDDQIRYLSTFTNTINLVLDRDTWYSKNKSLPVKYFQKYSLFFKKFNTIMIRDCDPKEMTDEQIKEEILK